MEIVKFKNGKFGIRKRNLYETIFNVGGVCKDFKPCLFQWRKSGDKHFEDCQLDTIEQARTQLSLLQNDFVESVVV